MKKNKVLAGLMAGALVLGSMTFPENISNFGTVFTQAAEVVASGEIIGSQRWNNALYWELDSEGTFTISPIQGNGVMYDYDYESTSYGDDERIPWYDVKDSIISVVIEEGVTHVGDSSFAYCENLESVKIAEGVTSIGSYAFRYCEKLTSVDLPDSLETIGDKTFQYCSALKSITLPQGLSSTGNFPFAYCSALEEIIVSEDNETYSSEDGLWYSKDMTTLILCPEGKAGDIVLPEVVSSISNYAFADCVGLTSVVLSRNLVTMGSGVFENCSNLTTAGPIGGDYTIEYYWTESIPDQAFWEDNCLISITIPNTVTSIGGYAFYKSVLTDIYFLGSESEWNEIALGEYNSLVLNSVNIHYAVTEEEEETSETESTSEAEETSETESTSEEEKTSEAESTSEAEETSETENTSATKETPETESTSEAEETSETESTSETEKTLETESISELEETSESETSGEEDIEELEYNLGDINLDGSVDYLDAMTALRYDAELIELSDAQIIAADVNGDDSVDSLDAILILRYDAGLVESFD